MILLKNLIYHLKSRWYALLLKVMKKSKNTLKISSFNAKAIKPEKQVEIEILSFLKSATFIEVDVIDSKATFSQKLSRYRKSKSAPVGFPDLVGNDENGTAFYIELKAKGNLGKLKEVQKRFLERKISSNCFAVCVDSAELFQKIYFHWMASNKSKHILMQYLNEC
jgi:VRR-NUC domain